MGKICILSLKIGLCVVGLGIFLAAIAVVTQDGNATAATPVAEKIQQVDVMPRPMPKSYSVCALDCALTALTAGEGGQCYAQFSSFHPEWSGSCCDHAPSSKMRFDYRPQGELYWATMDIDRGAYDFHDTYGCNGNWYITPFFAVDSNTLYEFQFICPTENCQCHDWVYIGECDE
ncbi:MAG: hypothetical protein JW941_00940 [Candidatus Coatesbacteria bacterium]|nr:hypothetical protein [Candidatus Coatesbacteria bacterium]